eukprot:7145931-Prymnesium_polylepis.3
MDAATTKLQRAWRSFAERAAAAGGGGGAHASRRPGGGAVARSRHLTSRAHMRPRPVGAHP